MLLSHSNVVPRAELKVESYECVLRTELKATRACFTMLTVDVLKIES